jgi:hypothetical protein
MTKLSSIDHYENDSTHTELISWVEVLVCTKTGFIHQ